MVARNQVKMVLENNESTGLFEPLIVSDDSAAQAGLNDLALDLATKSTALRSKIQPHMAKALANLVRAMNCYYSNLIEGHDTHPIDIERALQKDYSADPQKRNLQLEAQAHITVQEWIDEGGMTDLPTSSDMIVELHRRFCDLLPQDLLQIEDPVTKARQQVIPGMYRNSYVKVGAHIPISPEAVPRFMQRFSEAYAKLGRTQAIIAAACAHHRLLWVHPFWDGNGRVARLMSYAMLQRSVDAGGLWSVTRGLARQQADYKRHLAACDRPRQGDRDGRGSLSETALCNFAEFFLRAAIDQVSFMEGLMRPTELPKRILTWAQTEMEKGNLQPNSDRLLKAVLFQGQVERDEVETILGTSDRTARRVTSALQGQGVLISFGPKAPWQIAFPAKFAGSWMPELFPDKHN